MYLQKVISKKTSDPFVRIRGSTTLQLIVYLSVVSGAKQQIVTKAVRLRLGAVEETWINAYLPGEKVKTK
jgi:hypothetical protein